MDYTKRRITIGLRYKVILIGVRNEREERVYLS